MKKPTFRPTAPGQLTRSDANKILRDMGRSMGGRYGKSGRVTKGDVATKRVQNSFSLFAPHGKRQDATTSLGLKRRHP